MIFSLKIKPYANAEQVYHTLMCIRVSIVSFSSFCTTFAHVH